ncbi:MAG: hypothetical protein E6Y42_12320, partial [Enterococcus gallinarum]|nr:hypothetical protein [Enterococcus gallinarum]
MPSVSCERVNSFFLAHAMIRFLTFLNKENKIEMEAQLFAVQLLFQYLFAQGRLQEARTYILKQNDDIQSHRVIRNLLAMCYLYLSE